jgi:hypothetical protein
MAAVPPLPLLLALLLAVLSFPCAAVPFSVRIGLERIVLDAPPGFSDTTDLASPRLQDLAATLTSASNRVVIFALSDADVRKFTQGDPIDARRYAVVVTPKGLERNRVTPDQFTALVSDSLREFGKPVNPPDLIKFLEKQPIGRAHLLSELRKEPTTVSVLQGTRLPPLMGRAFQDNKEQFMFFSTTIFLVAGKALQLGVYSMYDSPDDIEWVRGMTVRWIDELLRLNPR